jgi:hypothetical protein
MEECKIHEKQIEVLEEKVTIMKDDLMHIRDNVHTLLGRGNDIVVSVINGKTEKRLASELLGELYVEMKLLRKATPKSLIQQLNSAVLPIIHWITLITLVLAVFFGKG